MISEALLNLLKDEEGYSEKPYKDSAGLLTIGIGHLLTKQELSTGMVGNPPVPWKSGVSHETALQLWEQDASHAETAVREVAVPLTPNQHDALVSFVFNVGATAFRHSTLLRVLNHGGYTAVPAQLARWIYAGGKLVEGLANRRRKEIALWSS